MRNIKECETCHYWTETKEARDLRKLMGCPLERGRSYMKKIVAPEFRTLLRSLWFVLRWLFWYVPAIAGIILFVPSLGWSWKLTKLAWDRWGRLFGYK